MKKLLSLLLLSLAATALAEEQGLYEITVAARECEIDTYDNLNCAYEIGQDLRFSITGIGEAESAVTFHHLDINGDFYAIVDEKNDCIAIKAGKSIDYETLRNWVLTGRTRAFVSTKSGKIYKSPQECALGY